MNPLKQKLLLTNNEAFNKNFSAILFVLAHIPFILYMHFWRLRARSLKLDGVLDQATYFHAELAITSIILLALILSLRFKRILLAAFTIIYFLSVFDWTSWMVQSKPFVFADLYRTYQIIVYYPEFFHAIPLHLKLKLAILLALPAMAYAFVRLFYRFFQSSTTLKGLIGYPVTLALILFLILSPIAVLNPKYKGFNSFFFLAAQQVHSFKVNQVDLSKNAIASKLGFSTDASSSQFTQTLKRNNPDILLFIIETTPSPFIKNFDQLVKQVYNKYGFQERVIFENHYTAYPSSDRATYSILTGKYPPMVEHNNWKSTADYSQTLVKQLNGAGYETHLYSTAPLSFYDDHIMHENIGFKHIHELETTKNLRTKTDDGYVWDREKLYHADLELIDLIKSNLSNVPSTPLFLAVAPQSSHAPFQCPPEVNKAKCDDDKGKIATNIEWQFQLLENLVQSLKKRNDNLIVVVTGDHGIRSKHESNLFTNPNILQEQAFHVPLALLLPEDKGYNTKNTRVTSHVDVPPTLLELAGIQFADNYFHGISLLRNSVDRRVYLVGSGYLPVDGFYYNGHYFMENKINGFYFRNNTPNFNGNNLESSREIRKTIQGELLFLEALVKDN